jgi:glycine cleavage system H protein
MNPATLLYAESHEWIHVETVGDQKVGTIGISDFAVKQLTDLVFMQLPAPGATVEAGKEFGEVESVKAVSPLYSPVSGTVLEVNSTLPQKLEILGSDPYGAGWLLRVALRDEAELKQLLSKDAYDLQCAAEG